MTKEDFKKQLSAYYGKILKDTNAAILVVGGLSADDEYKTFTDDELFEFFIKMSEKPLLDTVIRYNKAFFPHPWHSYAGDSHLVPDASGEWVKFKDIKKLFCKEGD